LSASRSLLLLVLGLAGCSSSVAPVKQGNIKSYGVEPVVGDSLGAMLARCSQPGQQAEPAERAASLNAQCDQLRRSLRNQPGNSASE
jgi:hypothetical protein